MIIRPDEAADPYNPWSLLHRFLVRSAGFPARIVIWPTGEVDAALTGLARAQAQLRTARTDFDQVIPATVADAPPGTARQSCARALYRWRRAVAGQRPVDPALAAVPAAARWADLWNSALAAEATAITRVDQAAAAAWRGDGARLAALANDSAFRTAVLTSNPDAYEHAVLPVAGGQGNARRLRMVYAYAQRFALKNETTSFFGPIDYGMFDETATEPEPTSHGIAGRDVTSDGTAEPGAWTPDGSAPRITCLAHWAAQTIADRAIEDPGLRAYLAPRVRAGLWCDPTGRLLVAATGASRALSPDSATALHAVQRGIEPDTGTTALLDRGVLMTDLTIPTAVDDPGAWLDGALGDLQAAGAHAAGRWRSGLARLRAGTARLGQADGQDRLVALRELERCFTELTGAPGRRRAGQAYSDRLLFTEHRRSRPGLLRVGGAEVLARRLAPLLSLCATYSLLIQRAVLSRALATHDAIGHGAPVPFLQFAAALENQVNPAALADDDNVARWLARLDAAITARTTGPGCQLGSDDLAPLLEPVPAGLVVSPDLFVVLPDGGSAAAAADAGIVVGEIHHGAQIWTSLSVLDPDLETTGREVAAALDAGDRDFAGLLFARTQGKSFERELPAGAVVEFRGRSTRPAAQVIPAESLLVVREHDRLLLGPTAAGAPLRLRPRHPRSATSWLFGPPPVLAPPVLRSAASGPRISVGSVLAWRRRWTIGAAALARLRAASTPGELVRAAAALTAELGLTSRVFVRTEPGTKPVFADLRCPRSLDHLMHRGRAATELTVTEMLPAPDSWWLAGRDGGAHSCEWRMTLRTTPDPRAPRTEPTG